MHCTMLFLRLFQCLKSMKRPKQNIYIKQQPAVGPHNSSQLAGIQLLFISAAWGFLNSTPLDY